MVFCDFDFVYSFIVFVISCADCLRWGDIVPGFGILVACLVFVVCIVFGALLNFLLLGGLDFGILLILVIW